VLDSGLAGRSESLAAIQTESLDAVRAERRWQGARLDPVRSEAAPRASPFAG